MGGTDMAVLRWAKEPQFYEKRVVQGRVLDIGPGVSPLAKFASQFSQALHYSSLDHQILESYSNERILGDATDGAEKLAPTQWDLVFSSHCLEHIDDPSRALRAWWDLVRPGGHLMVIVPTWVHYERLVWPPSKNSDHRTAWVMYLQATDRPLIDLWGRAYMRGAMNEVGVLPGATVHRAITLDEGFIPGPEDQTASLTHPCESGIEVVAQKAEVW